ncbi:GNAT family N-acetyltransferase [Aequorivita flava]|uniref:GNAT family N-acetyltransferase n=1 Tax=Aequorivita flava TaxID=3114371 RepID=A0AB35YQG9_9FLAO
MNSKRMLFRQYSEGDFDDYLKLVSNAEVMKMITGYALSKEEAKDRFDKMLKINLESPEIGHFKVICAKDEAFMGHSKLVLTAEGEAEIGYVLMPQYWGKGFGNEIAETLTNRGREVEKISTLIAIIDPVNIASQKILSNQGFQFDYNGEYFGLPATYFKLKL